MKYGKLDSLVGVDLSLPMDHPSNGFVSKDISIPRIFMGGTMWNIPLWKGKIYPLKATKASFIHHYCSQFSTIELNATHYRTPSKETVLEWYSASPDGFQFCPKFPQSISHYRRFRNAETPTSEFLEVILEFKEKLGPSFIQLPPNLNASKADSILNYLIDLPTDMKFAIEFRHPSWFTSDAGAQEVWALLKERKIGAVISDTAGRRDAVHMRLTAPFLIIRFGGNALDPSDTLRLNDWAKKIAQWGNLGLSNFYLFMHQPESILTPESCQFFAKSWKKQTGVSIPSPQVITSFF